MLTEIYIEALLIDEDMADLIETAYLEGKNRWRVSGAGLCLARID